MMPQLTRALVLEAPVAVPDGAGGTDVTWAPLGTIWAEMKPGSGRERAAGEVAVSDASWKITVRAAPHGAASRPTPRQRFRAGARLFRIEAVQETGPDARYLICRAVEEVTV